MADRASLEAALVALDAGRLIVKIGRSWFLAERRYATKIVGTDWIVRIAAGPSRARGILTTVGDNGDGREFRILPS